MDRQILQPIKVVPTPRYPARLEAVSRLYARDHERDLLEHFDRVAGFSKRGTASGVEATIIAAGNPAFKSHGTGQTLA